ncbi:AAHS family 3-hydroxyphenylpropionic acid transporter [Agrobacterium vitis]|nr:AAHS family 3-hydroxyphenylpropionic acid transporter [Agrobacterium vitis]MBE1439735.1 AAHS family 3-hydroxyphenylpropionic acid transporter [Agrobacterium vitis]
MNQTSQAGSSRILFLIFLSAVIEGFDFQAPGVVASRLAPVFHLSPGQIGLFFSMGTIGLLFGAIAGGALSDRFGRRAGLLVSMVVFGLFSLMTAFAQSVEFLMAARFLTGLGLGGALPAMVSVAAELAHPERRGRTVAMIYAGVPFGGGVASLVAMVGLHDDWQMVFIVGGILPLLLVVPLMMSMPPMRIVKLAGERGAQQWRAVLSAGSALITLLLWLGFFLGLLIVYLLINWLPMLMVSRGLTQIEASWVQVVFSLGGVMGSLVGGRLVDGAQRVARAGFCFVFLVASLLLLGLAPASFLATALFAAMVAIGLIAMQSMLYALAPQCYPAQIRGTAVGFAIAAGRLGSIAGPLLAGGVLAAGGSSTGVLMTIIPVAIICGVAMIALLVLLKGKSNGKVQAGFAAAP